MKAKAPFDPTSRTRNTQVVRVLGIVARLQRGYWSPGKLAEQMKVSERTIRRDMAAISHGRVDLRHDGIGRAWTLKTIDGRTGHLR